MRLLARTALLLAVGCASPPPRHETVEIPVGGLSPQAWEALARGRDANHFWAIQPKQAVEYRIDLRRRQIEAARTETLPEGTAVLREDVIAVFGRDPQLPQRFSLPEFVPLPSATRRPGHRTVAWWRPQDKPPAGTVWILEPDQKEPLILEPDVRTGLGGGQAVLVRGLGGNRVVLAPSEDVVPPVGYPSQLYVFQKSGLRHLRADDPPIQDLSPSGRYTLHYSSRVRKLKESWKLRTVDSPELVLTGDLEPGDAPPSIRYSPDESRAVLLWPEKLQVVDLLRRRVLDPVPLDPGPRHVLFLDDSVILVAGERRLQVVRPRPAKK
jgi:hypothetical protein